MPSVFDVFTSGLYYGATILFRVHLVVLCIIVCLGSRDNDGTGSYKVMKA